MSRLPAQHPSLSLHLTDLSLHPLVTSSSSPSQLDALTAVASSAMTAQAAVQRANLGGPQRIMVEYPDRGPVVLHSFVEPRQQQQHQSRGDRRAQGSGRDGERSGGGGKGGAPSKQKSRSRGGLASPSPSSSAVGGIPGGQTPTHLASPAIRSQNSSVYRNGNGGDGGAQDDDQGPAAAADEDEEEDDKDDDDAPPHQQSHNRPTTFDLSSASTTGALGHATLPEDRAPMLIGTVVAPSADEAHDARRAAARLERMGRGFQQAWTTDASGRHPAASES